MLIKQLEILSDSSYKKFSQRIVKTDLKMFGVRIPELRKIAKTINLDDFLKDYQGIYFEEIMIYGLALGNLKDLETLKKHLILYSKEVSDWSLCDSPAANLKLIRENNEYFFQTISNFLLSEDEYVVRFGLVLLLFHYLNDDYIDYILKVATEIKSDKYYINMALSWLLCECYIKYQTKTDDFISDKYLSKFVLNKTISKVCDSYRVSDEDKEMLKKRRIKTSS